MVVLYNSQILKCYGWARPLTAKLELRSAANRFQDGFVSMSAIFRNYPFTDGNTYQ